MRNVFFFYFKEMYYVYACYNRHCGDCANNVTADCFRPECIPASGVLRNMISVNRQFPGPSINVSILI